MKSEQEGSITWGGTTVDSESHTGVRESSWAPHWEWGKGEIATILGHTFRPGTTNLFISSRENLSIESLLLGLCLDSWAYMVSVVREEGMRENCLGGRLVKLLPTQNSFRAWSERRCGAHIHAVRGLYALSSPMGAKTWNDPLGFHPQVHPSTRRRRFTNWLNSAPFSNPGGGEDGTRVFDCGNQPGCIIFTCAHPGEAHGTKVLARAEAELSWSSAWSWAGAWALSLSWELPGTNRPGYLY